MKSFKIRFAVVFATILILMSFCMGSVYGASEEIVSLFSEKNAPVFWGATEITLSKNAVESFSAMDARFRLMAHDFEDGDVKVTVVGEDNVKPNEPGTYTLNYKAIDSHGNEAATDVKVIVKDDDNKEIDVVRTMYTLPNGSNMSNVGFSRCNTGDRQMLGIYLPAGKTFDIRVLEDGFNVGVACLGNDKWQETAVTETGKTEEWTTVKNTVDNDFSKGDFDSVPLATTPMMSKGESVNRTFKIEVRYKADEVDPLNYYKYGDENEDEFRTRWKESEHKFAFLECEVISFLLPISDIEAYTNEAYKDSFIFNGYDETFEYYQKVIYRMDEIVGLSLDPENSIDQSFRAKYLFKANVHGAGAAYYSGNHIATNNASMFTAFQMNWGSLHEIAHGYQGVLGGGASGMGLGEVSNNILGYYIQIDPDIYTIQKNYWLCNGDLSTIEEKCNAKRLGSDETPPEKFNELSGDEAPRDKLYALINLFDAFEGWKTYAKLFSWVRKNYTDRLKGINQQDMYALFFVEEYDTDITPYLTQWGLELSDSTVEASFGAADSVSIISDTVGEHVDEVLAGENTNLKYGLIGRSKLQKYDLSGNLKIDLGIDEVSLLENRVVFVERDNVKVGQATIKSGVAEFNALPVGSYSVRAPIVDGYIVSGKIATVESDATMQLDIEYSKHLSSDFIPSALRITGTYNTDGFVLSLISETQARIKLGAAGLGNQNDYWKANQDEVYVSVKITDESGVETYFKEVKGAGYFDTTNNTPATELNNYVGSTVTIFTNAPQFVHIHNLLLDSDLKQNVMTEFDNGLSGKQTLEFKITQYGFKPLYKENFDERKQLYDSVKEKLVDEVQKEYDYFKENPAPLKTKYLDRTHKQNFLDAYARLDEADREAFKDIYDGIIQGGKPLIELLTDRVEIDSLDDIIGIDWSTVATVTDNEDGVMTLSGSNVEIQSKNKGTYAARLSISDSDGNKASADITLVVKKSDMGLIIGIIAGVISIIALTLILLAVFFRKKKKSR